MGTLVLVKKPEMNPEKQRAALTNDMGQKDGCM